MSIGPIMIDLEGTSLSEEEKELITFNKFDAIAKWDIAGKEYKAKLTEVQCAK